MITKSNNEIKLRFVSILIYRLSLLMRTTGRYAAVPPFKKTLKITYTKFIVDHLSLNKM